MYPISDLTAFCRKTTGDVPPKLVGASTTVVGSKMYLYGGRLVSERKMVSDIYVFDLETFRWERVSQSPEDDIPQARYFHSADTWRNHLIIFGGMAIKPQSDNPEDLCVLNDVRLFDLSSRHWLPPAPISADSSLIPNARYAHLSSVTADRLFIIGGQDLANVWLDDVYIFELVAKTWIQRRDYPRHCGTYRSVAVTAEQRVRLPQDELRGMQPSTRLGQPGTRFSIDKKTPPAPNATQSDSLIHLPYSAAPTDEYPCDIFLFSNYNFTDVQRELEVFTPLSDGDFTVSDRSSSMTGTSFPPGLRFPTGAILGTFFIVAGTYLSQTYQSFSIWALDLINMTWSRIDPGSALASGSWFRSCLWASANKFVVFGNRHGNLVEDYNRRLLSWDHVTCIDLEAFGIYQPPPLQLDISMQELGLAALEEGLMSDFEIICDDGRRIKVARKLLEDRWPWFKEQRKLFVQAATRVLETMPSVSSHTPPPDVPSANRQDPRPDPRLTARAFNLSEPYPITLAFVQYFYSMALITPLQHAPAVLSQLLLLSSTYQLTHLQALVKHAMHRALSYATSVGIYGVSTLCSCRSLQIRALRVVMAYSQKRPAGGRSKNDKDGGVGGGRSSDASGASGGNGRLDAPAAARPRGMSDASYMRGASDSGSSNPRGFARGAANSEPLSVLADLQEFGILGRELPLPTMGIVPVFPTTSKRADSVSASKRLSNTSTALSALNEEEIYLDMSPPTSPATPVTPITLVPSPTVPLPNPPIQERPKRTSTLDTLSSLNTLGERDNVLHFKISPTPRPRRMASAENVSSYTSSSRGGHLESSHTFLTFKQSPSPPSIIIPTPAPRPLSVMSQSTEQDLLDFAEMLSPTVDATSVEMEPIPDAPPLAELESFNETFPGEVVAMHGSVGSSQSVFASSSQCRTFTATSIRSTSISTDSDEASCIGDDVSDAALLSLPPHLANGSFTHHRGSFGLPPPLDDSGSLSSSTSYSSLRTPSLSRTSSLRYLASPPISPTSSSHSPSDAASPSSPLVPNPNAKLLDIIEESLLAEEAVDYHHSHHHSHSHSWDASEAKAINLDDYIDPEEAPSGRVYLPSRDDSHFVREGESSRNRSQGHSRSPVSSSYNSEPRGPLRGPASASGSRSESQVSQRPPVAPISRRGSSSLLRSPASMSTTESKTLPPNRTYSTRKPPPPLQFKAIGAPASSSASAPPFDMPMSSPSGHQQPSHPQQRYSAHALTALPRLPFGQEQQPPFAELNHELNREYDQEREHRRERERERERERDRDRELAFYAREMQSPFGKLPPPHSVESLSPCTPRISTPETPESFAASLPETGTEVKRKLVPWHARPQGKPQGLPLDFPAPPLVPPMPLSPVLSAHSDKSSIKTGIGKLFGKSNGGSDLRLSKTSSGSDSSASMSTLNLSTMSKAEEKRLKKEAARARTERLAYDLAEKAKRRAEAAKAAKANYIQEKTKRPWEESGGMYDGISYV